MNKTTRRCRPKIAIPCDIKTIGVHPFHAAGEKYIKAIETGTDCLPVLVPALACPAVFEDIFSIADGIFLTGSWSNVHPDHYGDIPFQDNILYDPARDALTLNLIRESLARNVPLFGVCRGFQEMNVALGGTLHQQVHDVPQEPGFTPRLDHRENKTLSLDEQYAPAHNVTLVKNGILEKILGISEIQVNSLHGQGIAMPAPGLTIEGRAPDGLIEAFSVKDAGAFALAVQWHPEWKFQDNPVSRALFQAFGDAVRKAVLYKENRAENP